ncbi:hypothetical protein F4824DRAFT_505148 [Ustulina deusta]|nr:hypothetical protein F4824DRAFT_505148 [Ustulina deusta]
MQGHTEAISMEDLLSIEPTGASRALCCKCDSSPTDPSEGPTLWHCPAHLQLVSEDKDVSVEEAQAFFGKAVVLWPVDHQKRYLRRKDDSAAKGVWWSY